MIRTALKVLAADIVLVAVVLWVLQDLQWRSGYAASAHDACSGVCSYTPSLGYTLLTQFFTMAGNGVRLTSPATLDWVQALAYALILVNAWFGYRILKSRKGGPIEGKSVLAPVE